MSAPSHPKDQPEVPQGPRVSVLVVSWNCVDALRRCLTSVRASKGFETVETLVVDAGSRDGSERIDEEFPWITPLRLPRNFGKTRARNIGVRTAKGEFIFLLSPDVELQPETIDRLSSRLQQREELVAISAGIVNASGSAVRIAYRLPSASDLRDACEAGGDLALVDGSSGFAEGVLDYALMVRRVFVKGMNYFEEKRFSEFWSDLELCYQIQTSGKKIAIADDALARLFPSERSIVLDSAAKTLLAADRISGAAGYLSKHEGFLQGTLFRLRFALASMLRPRLFFAILAGERVDGTQGGSLG